MPSGILLHYATKLSLTAMPDTRTRRGPHPKDHELFSRRWIPVLESAVEDLSWLLGRGYSDRAALKLVGDRHALRDRQRKALQRCAASDASCQRRRQKVLARRQLRDQTVVVDGYNVLLTLEAALCGGLLLLGRDGVLRDLASMSAHYRRVDVTPAAISLLADFFRQTGCAQVIWYLDRPVSNSGRLKKLIQTTVADRSPSWRIDLTDRTDSLLASSPHVVASADSAVIDASRRWFNLARTVVEQNVDDAWILDFSTTSAGAAPAVKNL
jgi:hypothetical protein